MVKKEPEMKNELYAVAMLIKKGDQFLGVSRRTDYTNFGLPGGKIDDGESPIESIIREMKEECGIDLDKRILDNCFVFERSEEGKVCRTYVYTGPEMEIVEGIHEDNGGWCKWVTRKDLENGCFGIYNTALFKCFQDYIMMMVYQKEKIKRSTNGNSAN